MYSQDFYSPDRIDFDATISSMIYECLENDTYMLNCSSSKWHPIRPLYLGCTNKTGEYVLPANTFTQSPTIKLKQKLLALKKDENKITRISRKIVE